MSETASYCPTCHRGTWACRCGVEVERSVLIHGSVLATRTKRRYYDSEPVRQQFGADAKERMMEETQGLGYVKMIDGVPMHRDSKSGDVVPLTDKQVGFMLGEDRAGDGGRKDG